jgi:hypothetical protein
MIEQTLPREMLDMAAAQQEKENDLLTAQNVVGVALGNRIKKDVETEEPVISVLVSQKMETDLLLENDRVPKKIKNFATDVVEVGDIFAGDNDNGEELAAGAREEVDEVQAGPFSSRLNRRIRPAMGGFSVGPYKGPTGTLGTCCYDLWPFPSIPPRYYMLSNNHVLAGSNKFPLGWPILQPGPADGGVYPADFIARLSRYVPIQFISPTSAPCNYVDAAIAEGNLQDLNREIYWVGYLKRLYIAPKIGDIVEKAGRTTGFTTGKVTNINGTVNVNYGGGKVAKFCRQIITTNISAPGDSGSLVANLDEGAVGLLFAGSSTRTIVNNILYVQVLLRIRVTEK